MRFAAAGLSAILFIPALATAEGKLDRPHRISALGTYGGVSYNRYDGFFSGRTSTGDYRVPYRIDAPTNSSLGNGAVIMEPPHFAAGPALPEAFLGRRLLFGQRFAHAAVGYSLITFGDPDHTITNRIIDPAAKGVFIHGGVVLPFEDGPTDDEITVDFARALTTDGVARAMLGTVQHRYLAGFSDSSSPVKRIIWSGAAEGVFDLVMPIIADSDDDPQLAIADGRYSGKVMTVDSEVEWFYGRALEDRGGSPEHYRYFIVAGTPHVAHDIAATPATYMAALRAHFIQAHRWVTEGVPPPPSTLLAMTYASLSHCDAVIPPDLRPAPDELKIDRDENCNALMAGSATRLPALVLGEATFITGFLGDYAPKPPATLSALGFSSDADYLAAFDAAVDAQVASGDMLPDDAAIYRARARMSPGATFTESYFARYADFSALDDLPAAGATPLRNRGRVFSGWHVP